MYILNLLTSEETYQNPILLPLNYEEKKTHFYQPEVIHTAKSQFSVNDVEIHHGVHRHSHSLGTGSKRHFFLNLKSNLGFWKIYIEVDIDQD